MASRMASFLPTCLAGVPDSRGLHVRRHPLLSILLLAPTAVTGGVDTWVEVEDFGRDHRDWFAQWMQTPPRPADRSGGGLGRQDYPAFARPSALHTVSVYTCERRLAQMAGAAKFNKMTDIPEVLALGGTTGTIDCQKDPVYSRPTMY